MSLVEIGSVGPAAVAHTLELLGRAGIAAKALDSPDTTVRYAAHGGYRVRIAVPAAQARQARAVLADAARDGAERLRPLVGKLRLVFATILLVLIAAVVIALRSH